jgi:flagellar hook-associated protein 3 FlgL
MSLRISTAQLYNSGVGGIQQLQSSLYTLQNQIDTGRRIVTPQDDPVASAQALVVTQSMSVNELYINNQGAASSKLSALDSTLAGINEELQNIYEKSIAAGNGTYSATDRAAIATELEQRLTSLVSLANTQDGTGRYVFAGFDSTTAPFSLTNNATSLAFPIFSSANQYVQYNGDQGQQQLQVTASFSLATNISGNEIFTDVRDANGNLTGSSIFDSVKNMVDYLRGSADVTYSAVLGEISASMETVSRARTIAGARLSSLETMTYTAGDRDLQYKTQLSSLEDLDYAKALTDVSQKKIQLEAAQATFASMSKLSLFDYI